MVEKSEIVSTEETQGYKPYQWFFNKEVIGSVLLMLASVSAVIIANSVYYKVYEHWLHLDISFFFGNYMIRAKPWL